MHTVLRVSVGRQRIAIIVLEFGGLPPLENQSGKRVTCLGEILEDAGSRRPGAGCRLAGTRQPHFTEEDVTELLRRADVEGRARHLEDLRFKPRRVERELA